MALRILVLAAFLSPPAALRAQQAAPWQQEVAYEMDVTLFADRNQFRGTQRLSYVNNSPDTLRTVFYHLYFNAFHPHSLMAERNRHLPDPDPRIVPRIFELGEHEIGLQRVSALAQDGRPVGWEVHDTVMKVALARPVYPGESTVLEMSFEGQVPLQTRRSGRDNHEGVRFSMAQWYPKIAHYDAIGWHPHPYIGREFYAPFGSFDVRLTLPSEYVVGATGTLQNPGEVGHGYEQPPDAGRVVTGPARRPDGSTPDSLTWHFRADRVHDFAWAADPGFIHERHLVTNVPGRAEPVHIHLFYLHDVAQAWRLMGGWVAEMTRFFSERYGPYPYPQFTVAQGGDGGMEYPMMTLITGRRPPGSLFSVTAHEYAHMWFHAAVASNESLFSWIDEGFTNYATREATHHIFHGREGLADHSSAMQAVVRAQRAGLYERPNKAADWYDTNTGFGIATYSAGQAFIDLLGYVIGDVQRDRFLRRFATEWRFRHPYPADVLQTAQKESGMQLYWLFEQFLTGGERYDYAATGLQVEAATQGYRNTVTLERRGTGVLPVDLWVRFADDTAQWIHIPVDVAHGHKPVPAGWAVAEAWPWVQPSFELKFDSAHPVVEAVIDPLYRTPDLDRANNRVARGRNVPLAFDGFFQMPRTYGDALSATLSPIGGVSHQYGLGVGAQVRARAPHARRDLQLAISVWPQAVADADRGLPLDTADGGPLDPSPPANGQRAAAGAWHDGIDHTLRYRRRLSPFASASIDSRKYLGIIENRIGARILIGGREPMTEPFAQVSLSFAHQHRTSDRAFQAAPAAAGVPGFEYGSLFGRDHLLGSRLDLELGSDRAELAVLLEVGGALREPQQAACLPLVDCPAGGIRSANRIVLSGGASLPLSRALVLRPRAGAGLGSRHLVPQKMFRLGGAAVETRWRSASFSVPAAAFPDPAGDAHLFALSGFGPVAYLLSPVGTPTGNALLAGTLSLEAGPLRFAEADPEMEALLAPLRVELFGSVGAAWQTREAPRRGDWLADAGVGFRYDLSELELLESLIRQSDVLREMRFTVRLPLWVSHPDRVDGAESLGFRWLLGIETGL